MVDGLADIMQQTGTLGLFDIHAQLRGHHAAQAETSRECCSTFWVKDVR